MRYVRHCFVGLVLLGLIAGLMTAPAGAAAPRAQQGVTKNKIDIVLIIPDLDKLRSRGINVSNQTNADFVKRFSAYVDPFGTINGRKINIIPVGWDPLDATSFDKACTAATQDNHPFVVVNGSGYGTNSFGCVTVDNHTPFIAGDFGYSKLFKASGKNLLTLGLPSEVAAKGAADLIDKTKSVNKSAKIGILSSNIPGVKAAGDALDSELKKKGYNVVSKVEINGLAADQGVLGRESQAAADTFQAKGVDTVFNMNSWTGISGFYGEVDKNKLNFKVYAIDGQANTCTPFAATRATPLAAGATCITAWDGRTAATKDKIKPDDAFEAKCRQEYEKATGTKTTRGGASGALDANNVTYPGDFAPNECTIANFLLPAIKKAGKNLTWDKVYANLIAATKGSAAYMSQGQGGFGKNKPYWAKPVMHFEEMVYAAWDTTKNADGLFNGCAVPAPCFATKLVNGQDWFPIKG